MKSAHQPQVTEETKKTHITQDDFVIVEGIDMFNPYGKLKTALSVKDSKRTEFFSQHKLIEALLRCHPKNPLLEEGKFASTQRDHKGEYFITPDALALLIHKKIRQHQTSKQGIPYNTKNTFVINNDPDALKDILENLNLQDNEDAKFIYIEQVHAIPFYLRNDNNQLKCFIVDSQSITSGSITVATSVLIHTLNPLVVMSGADLQKDFYSCSTFATKALMYFAKHGAEVFQHIEKVGTKKHPNFDWDMLEAIDLMPTLLKMSQTQYKLSEETLNSIVSTKSKKTLGEYLNENCASLKSKSFNAAASKKRYKFFAEIDSIMTEMGIKEIGTNKHFSLPGTAIDIIQDLAVAPKCKHFVDICVEAVKYLENPPTESKGDKICEVSPETNAFLQRLKQHYPSYTSLCQRVFHDIHAESKNDFGQINQLNKVLFMGIYAELLDARLAASAAEEYAYMFLNHFKTCENTLKYLKHQPILNANQFVNKLTTINSSTQLDPDQSSKFMP